MKKLLLTLLAITLLSACTSSYTKKVDLTPEERAAIEATIAEYQQKAADFKPADQFDRIIPDQETIEIARGYEKLGELGKAIDAYTYWLDQGHKTRAFISNLGRLYEQVGETKKAVEQYQRMIDEYQDVAYYYDIAWAYINSGKSKYADEAGKAYSAWAATTGNVDVQTQLAIKKLRK
jgi:tetratricopeptide (TPR) repeat protein